MYLLWLRQFYGENTGTAPPPQMQLGLNYVKVWVLNYKQKSLELEPIPNDLSVNARDPEGPYPAYFVDFPLSICGLSPLNLWTSPSQFEDFPAHFEDLGPKI